MHIRKIILSIVLTCTTSYGYADAEKGCEDIFCDPCSGWDVYGELIYWRLRKSDLDYVINGETANVLDGATEYISTRYRPGFRVGFVKECSNFDFGASYTFLNSYRSKEAILKPDALLPVRLHPANLGGLGTDSIDFARSAYEAKLDLFDIEVGKEICMSTCLGIRPFLGYNYSRITQTMRTVYQEENGAIVGIKITEKNKMDAYGFYLGSDINVSLGACANLIGSFRSGVYAADFVVKHKEVEYNGSAFGDGNNGQEFMDIDKRQWLVVCSCSFTAGVSIDFGCVCNTYWNTVVGYELHEWIGTPDFLNFTDDHTRGTFARNGSNLGYHGLVLRFNGSF